ncbi:DUF2267 domain-containing protein [Nocardia farcinica]|uniref:DUF2267 domain-containing protein n=1 Tax=Nocardia farcinica TaxID=37329 RepID=UPI001894F14E|nr:DUF2267 domain-containing protein [Nocardia farcinica]MBF6235028.1 DUF2267 domain-containing protein [Nocardia farcinica]
MSDRHDPLAPAVHTANIWLRAVADGLGTDDRFFAHRVTRAWLHCVRDRLGVTSAARLSAQLPEILRGMYFEGWLPARVPVPHGVDSFVRQFADEARVGDDEAGALTGAVTGALAGLFSPGQLDHVLAVLPAELRGLLLGADYAGPLPDTLPTAAVDAPGHLWEDRLSTLTEAVTVLARGLAGSPTADGADPAAAAQQAYRLLLAEVSTADRVG